MTAKEIRDNSKKYGRINNCVAEKIGGEIYEI